MGCLVSFQQSPWELAKRGDMWGSAPNLATFIGEDLAFGKRRPKGHVEEKEAQD